MSIQGVSKIKNQRLKAKLSQDKAAELIGINQPYLSKLESGEFFPSPPRLIVKMAKVFKCKYEELYEDLDRLMPLYFKKEGQKIVLTEGGKIAIEAEEARRKEKVK